MSKKKCSLCGGPLENNRCTFCGLDNSIYNKKSTRRQSAAETEQKSSVTAGSRHPVPNRPQSGSKPSGSSQAIRPAALQKSRSGKSKTGPLTAVIILIIILIAAVFSLIPEEIGSFETDIFDSGSSFLNSDNWFGGNDTYDYSADYDPYGNVKREIPAEGENYETILGNGNYRVGIHIPEGIYQVELEEGSGGLNIEDSENLIYHSVMFGTDSEYDETAFQNDIRLYNGANLSVDSGVILKFTTENAQPLTQEPQENPLSDPVFLAEGEYTSGPDTIPEGIYDISVADTSENGYGYSSICLTYPNGYSEFLWADGPDYAPVTDEYSSTSIKNIVIADGTTVSVEYGGIILTPGEGYYDIDYSDFISEDIDSF